jgi:heme exporter protein A
LACFGPNGSGKTTLLRIAARLSMPTSGRACLFGADVSTQGEEIRQRIGFVSHTSFLYPSLTAVENLTFYASMFGLESAADMIDAFLHNVGLADRQHEMVRTFSRGMQQRLALARALLHHPQLVLLDEPYAGLDGAGVKLLQRILADLHAEGRTILLTTHQPELGLQQCDQVAVLVQGRVIYTGSPANVRLKS